MVSSLACWLCQLLSFPVPEAFLRGSTRAVFAAGTALCIVLLLGPWFIRKLSEMKCGQPIRDDAGFLLGELHIGGRGMRKNEAEGFNWYRKAAEQGYADAQLNLSLMLHKGQGTAKNEVEAVKWYRKAAEQGDAHAQNNLGLMYDNGQGVTQD